MKIDDVINAADGLDDKNRSGISKLIDLKVESDMNQVLTAIHSEFKLLNSKFEHVESKISTGYTFFGIALGVISTVLAILGVMVAMLVFKS